jgi:hypothetical protein
MHVQLMAAYLAEGYLFVHAGVVGWQGRAIVIPGRSFTGKTSLVTALVRAGATYYSDEYAIFDPQGRVHPYPRPLSIREEAGRKPRLYPVETLGGQAGQTPLPVGLVVVTEYQAGARWQPRTLSPSRALLSWDRWFPRPPPSKASGMRPRISWSRCWTAWPRHLPRATLACNMPGFSHQMNAPSQNCCNTGIYR